MFELTQNLIDLYPPVLKQIQSFSSKIPSTTPHMSRRTIDQASLHQLLSCHHRTLDMWDLVFQHLKRSVENGKCNPKATGSPSPCHRLRIGSFVPTTKVPMELVLAIEFQKLLLDCTHDLDESVSSVSKAVDINTTQDAPQSDSLDSWKGRLLSVESRFNLKTSTPHSFPFLFDPISCGLVSPSKVHIPPLARADPVL
ncbi:hypothetical protein CIHG_04636 [Coccidioides immitis H538.4]|uniref:Uncharacterized protein n=1 Tax=Coccidioides immitis H538.4 TaxID=396776 RepID=A0A0J8RPU4_COCIT|nr:hypothetical protein CIHG_04636 [Coccidioides immitis H538.4]